MYFFGIFSFWSLFFLSPLAVYLFSSGCTITCSVENAGLYLRDLPECTSLVKWKPLVTWES